MSLLVELQLLGGLGCRLTASAFTLLQIRVQTRVLHLQTAGLSLDIGHLDEEDVFLFVLKIFSVPRSCAMADNSRKAESEMMNLGCNTLLYRLHFQMVP